MTKKEYANYTVSVEEFFRREGITNLSTIGDSSGHAEEFFSWNRCDVCRRPEGGMREDCNGYNPTTKKIQEYTVCSDCIYYCEYGQLDDRTMLAIEEATE
jgi:hypothetical protein